MDWLDYTTQPVWNFLQFQLFPPSGLDDNMADLSAAQTYAMVFVKGDPHLPQNHPYRQTDDKLSDSGAEVQNLSRHRGR